MQSYLKLKRSEKLLEEHKLICRNKGGQVGNVPLGSNGELIKNL